MNTFFKIILIILMVIFLSCEKEKFVRDDEAVNDDDAMENNDIIEESMDEDNGETSDIDEEESCCRFVNTAVSANNSGEIYIAGHTRDKNYGCNCDYYGFYRYLENSEWKTVYVCNEPGGGCANRMQGVWISEKNKAYIVGFSTSPILVNKIEWEFFRMNNGGNPYLVDIWGTSSTDVFAAGGDDYPRIGAIFHFDGIEWTKMQIPTENELNGVWGTSSDDVYAVGKNGTILHYDGEKWTEMESGTTEYLSDVWGSGKDDVYIVGENIILHYDGEKWDRVLSDEKYYFIGLHGNSADNIAVIGRSIDPEIKKPVIFHSNGDNWSEVDTEIENLLFDIHAMPDGSFYVVGDNDTIERITL